MSMARPQAMFAQPVMDHSSITASNVGADLYAKLEKASSHTLMPRWKKIPGGLANPAKLGTFDKSDEDLIVVITETPKGCRNKYAYDVKGHMFELRKVLPAGMSFLSGAN
jgi:hypothetical protein